LTPLSVQGDGPIAIRDQIRVEPRDENLAPEFWERDFLFLLVGNLKGGKNA
jgi:hypothetical protein